MRFLPSVRKRSRLLYVVALFTLVVFLAGTVAGCNRDADGNIVATVNGEPITKDDLYREMYAQAGQETLQQLITQTLILQEGKANGIEVSAAEITARLDEVIEDGFSSRDEFLEVLAAYNLKQEDIERQVRIQLVAEKILSDQIELDEDEARAYFEANREQFGQPERIKARHILLETREEAETVRAALIAGADFAEQARENSNDIFTAGTGGDLGIINRSPTLQPWQQSLFELKETALSTVLEGPTGFHVAEVLEKYPAEEPSFDDAKDRVLRLLKEQQMSMLYPAWVESLHAKAEIKY